MRNQLHSLTVILGLALALLFVGCDDGGEVTGDQVMADAADDGNLADTASAPACSEGEMVPSPDGCGSCVCTMGEWSCSGGCVVQPLECPAPGEADADVVCSGVVVFARDPATSTCCRYDNSCVAPTEWPHFFSLSDCERECDDGAIRRADDDCNTCVCVDSGWQCTSETCAEPAALACQTDADCLVTGCADDVCAATEIATSCDTLPGDECWAEESGCGCIDGTCAWTPTPELAICLADEAFCSPGQVRAHPDGCNLCWCTAEGTWACGDKECGFCPAGNKNNPICQGGTVWAKDPSTGVCCAYDSSCEAPQEWPVFGALNECQPSGCTPGDEQPSANGCGTCTCSDAGEWSCSDEACQLVACETDDDCFSTGCHGQICAGAERFTSCAWKADYACYAEPFTGCGCNDGVCGWAAAPALEACLAATN